MNTRVIPDRFNITTVIIHEKVSSISDVWLLQFDHSSGGNNVRSDIKTGSRGLVY